jgi:hypothetical protein
MTAYENTLDEWQLQVRHIPDPVVILGTYSNADVAPEDPVDDDAALDSCTTRHHFVKSIDVRLNSTTLRCRCS